MNLYFEIDTSAVDSDHELNLTAAGDLLKIFETNTPGLGPDDTLAAMRYFFEGCVNIADDWLRPQMSLPIIVKYFNRIKKTLEQPSTKGATDAEIAKIIARKWGTDSPERII